MPKHRRQWRSQLTRAEEGRGWVFFALYVLAFPFLMGLVQRSFGGELPVAEASVIYYLLSVTLVFLVFWSFLKNGFYLLLDWLPENLFAFGTGLVGAGALHFLVMRLPYPVENPNAYNYLEQYAMSPAATVVIVVVLMPIVEEALFRGLLFGAVRRYSPGAGLWALHPALRGVLRMAVRVYLQRDGPALPAAVCAVRAHVPGPVLEL